jgi:hypothetical protein
MIARNLSRDAVCCAKMHMIRPRRRVFEQVVNQAITAHLRQLPSEARLRNFDLSRSASFAL